MWIENGKQTQLQNGDHITFDIDNHSVEVTRNGQSLQRSDGDTFYCLMPSDGVEFQALVELLADAAGMSGVEEVKKEEKLTYVFRK